MHWQVILYLSTIAFDLLFLTILLANSISSTSSGVGVLSVTVFKSATVSILVSLSCTNTPFNKARNCFFGSLASLRTVDALKQAIEKAKSFGFDLNGAVMASDAFFPFPDCVEIADKEGITAVIQPGGSVKDDLSFAYCNEHGMAMVTTGIRHFKH